MLAKRELSGLPGLAKSIRIGPCRKDVGQHPLVPVAPVPVAMCVPSPLLPWGGYLLPRGANMDGILSFTPTELERGSAGIVYPWLTLCGCQQFAVCAG